MPNPTHLDYEAVAELTRRKGGGKAPISTSTLRKDRVGQQRFRFFRVGSRALYDLDLVVEDLARDPSGPRPTTRRKFPAV